MVEQLDRLLESLQQLHDARPGVVRRLELARELRARTIDEHADVWRAASERVADDARFEGFALAPQVGLAPLGPNPGSRLEEFAHFASGAVPARDPLGELAIDGASAIVLVLIPGAEFVLGVVAPNVDPWCGKWGGPTKRVTLVPCFLAKHELTRGQLKRHTGADPSSLAPEEARLQADLAFLPVETVSWESAARSGTLPTYAAPVWGVRAARRVDWSALRPAQPTLDACSTAPSAPAGAPP